ncbi:hypothetical protein [Bacillus pumilus]|uniref:hypothetical protein n=1 Tax=Bacillus pumilus TaxID=1408 RepID=UPI0011A81EB1|nr:hypothetical protein [Bacillus pumilus]
MRVSNMEIKNSRVGNMFPTANLIQCNYNKSGLLKAKNYKIRYGFGLKRRLLTKEYQGTAISLRFSSLTTLEIVYYKYLPEIDVLLWSVGG